jgi:hypothetical protein
MPPEVDANSFLISPTAVRLALKHLTSARVHPTFAGYLCTCHDARSQGKTRDVQPNFKSFFDSFLRVDGAPDDKPYLMPFRESKGASWTPFFNRNVAGSYAPSSLREVSPFQLVVSVAGSKRQATYSLVSDHASKARQHLLFGKRLGVVSLSAFLYRDYGLELMPASGGLTSVFRSEGLVSVFRDEFGFRSDIPQENSDFGKLFSDDSAEFPDEQLFIKTTLG